MLGPRPCKADQAARAATEKRKSLKRELPLLELTALRESANVKQERENFV